mmetsp:Transcript_23052/g.68315  ORF Transcript_23052/g.68315 Transcript_23052/m.68315 type:complete len:799 (-) Transcript_23052:140-2536(-)
MVVVSAALLALVLPHRAFPAAPRAPSPLLLGDAPGAASIAAATAARAEAASKALADAARPASEFLLDATRPAIDAATPVLDPVLRATEQARVQWQLYGSEHPAEQVGLGLSVLLLLELVREVVAAGGDERPYPRDAYDPDAARAFFVRRPLEVLARAVELGVRSAGFGGALLSDWLAGPAALEANAEERALQLAKVLTALGPTFIKAGQSASIRTDLLAPPYIRGLTSLQDQVPPFPTDEATALIREELGGAEGVEALLDSLSAEPVAAASLGQVYRGALPDGTPIALKVQRPRMARQIALDMLLIREVLAPLASAVGLPGDLVGTADAWGEGFVAELDYSAEAANAALFNANVRQGQLSGSVFAPPVVEGFSSRRVLTTEWVDGERLDRCRAPEDVPRLCSLAMSTYLQMMLQDGVLHCDPHPGNLLRTAEGKLCILDWGLVTTISPDLQLTLIEHVAHLTAEDYAKVPNDLVRLGFVPEGGETDIESSGVVDYLTFVYSTWNSGGGASKLDVPALLARVQELTAETENGLFQIPPYFAYVAKSFSVLEGIGLSSDPDYSIVQETLPYISRRIMSDPSPRTAGALETFVFGDVKDDRTARVLSPKRVETLLQGARKYAAATAAVDGADPTLLQPLDTEAAADALLDTLQTPSPLQALVVEQLTLVLAASSRQLWSRLRDASPRVELAGGEDRSLLGLLVDPLGLFRASRLVENDERDHKALEAARRLVEAASSLVGGAPADATAGPDGEGAANAEAAALARALVRKAWERREHIPAISRLFLVEALDQTAARLGRGR